MEGCGSGKAPERRVERRRGEGSLAGLVRAWGGHDERAQPTPWVRSKLTRSEASRGSVNGRRQHEGARGEPLRFVGRASNDKARELLGWAPTRLAPGAKLRSAIIRAGTRDRSSVPLHDPHLQRVPRRLQGEAMTCTMLGYAGLGAVRRCRTTNTQSPMSPPLAWYPSSQETRAVRDVL